jgi:hypothetical protein
MKVAPLEQNSLLRLFGSPHEVIAKAENDLARLIHALSLGHQREAVWALMDCSITIFHVGDWIRAAHTDHRRASSDLSAGSHWIRMTRDICHAAKHGDLTWKTADARMHGPILAKLEYASAKHGDEPLHYIVAVEKDNTRHDVIDVLRLAIAEWSRFINERRI